MKKLSSRVSEIDLLQSGYRYGLALSGNKQDAEDLVHDAWLRLIKRYQVTPEKPLMFRTIRNLYIDQIRKEKLVIRHQESSFNDATLHESDLERDVIAADEMRHHLAKLRDVENEVLFLSVVEGYTSDEIASLTKSTRGSVLSMLHRSKQKLRNWLMDDRNSTSNVISLPTTKARS